MAVGARRSVVYLALRDLRHDAVVSAVSVLIVVIILTPLLILFGLKEGAVDILRARLAADPNALEIKHFGETGFDDAWIESARARPGVGFLIPRTRHTHTAILLLNRANPDAEPTEVDLIPSAAGDPLLRFHGGAPPSADELVLSAIAADALKIEAGQSVTAVIERSLDGVRIEREPISLAIGGVLPEQASGRRLAFAPLELMAAVEDYREWRRVERYGWPGDAPTQDGYASFRLYAETIDDVPALAAWLRTQHLEVESASDKIEAIKRIDRDLTVLFGILVGLGVVGFVAFLALNQVAAVARKRRSLAVLRLLGYSPAAVASFPVAQGVAIAAAGSICAIAAFHLTEPVVNLLFADAIERSGRLTRLGASDFAVAVAVSIVIAGCASLLAARRAIEISPGEDLRDG